MNPYCGRRSCLLMLHFTRCIQRLSLTMTPQFFGTRRFMASSKRSRTESERRSSLASSTTSPPSLLDAFIKRAQSRQHEISESLSQRGWACIDEFMGADACAAMRAEATNLMKVKPPITVILDFCSVLNALSCASVQHYASIKIIKVGRFCWRPCAIRQTQCSEHRNDRRRHASAIKNISLAAISSSSASRSGSSPLLSFTSTQWLLFGLLLLMCENPDCTFLSLQPVV
jgi:hypothetical protein